jgi:hypothetical protein
VNGATSIALDNSLGDVTGVSSKKITPGQTKTYTLTASNSAGSATAQVTVSVTYSQDGMPPTVPTLTGAIARSSSQVDLTWTASTDNVGVAGYQIVRNGAVLTTASGTSYSDLSVTGGATYVYSVRAYDAASNFSALSNQISLTTLTPPVSGSCPAPATGAFTGCYYNNLTMSGTPSLVRVDNHINFDWGTGSPASSVPPGNFSARWKGNFQLPAGNYSFVTTGSDGVRLYVDGNLVLDRWRDQAATTYTSVQSLSGGTHLITVEYYESTGWPSVHLTWQKLP